MLKEKEFFYRPLPEVFRNRKVSFDMDGVLSLTTYPVVEKVNEDFGTSYGVGDFFGWATVKTWVEQNWDRRKSSVDGVARNPKEYDMWVWTDPEILFKGLLAPGADHVTRCSIGAADDYRVITSRIPALRESTLKWHKTNLPWIDESKVSINSDPNLSGEVFKYKEIERLGIELHFEDSLRHAKLIVEHTPAIVILLANWDVLENASFFHPRIIQLLRPNNRMITMRDVHKKLIFEPNFIPSHNIDRANTL